ncbi:aminomethyltransferase, partial [bacterium]|nr:aminomethyltransferase [bacterium]
MDWKFDMELLEPELDRIEKHLELGMDRIPQFKNVGIKKIICGPITHTPDDNFLAGPAPGLKNFWMACAASVGIAQGGGAGKYMAQWMTYGDADINMLEFEPRRYMSWANKDYVIKKSSDQYRRMYFTPLPNESIETGRPMKKTPIYNKLKESGAMYLDSYGWEKPCWFAKKGMKEEYGFKRTNAFTYVQTECENVQNNVGVLDLSTFAKYEISGKDSETFLERLCANRIPKKDGSIILTHMLNSKGRIQSELTITRFPNNIFYVLSSTASEIRDFDWFNRHLSKGETVNIKNVTKDYGVLVLAGPKSRKVLSQLTSQNLNNNDFPWLKGKEILINKIPVRALRVNYVGELGWELHLPRDSADSVYDVLMEAGKNSGIANAGYRAIESLRLEKSYRTWGADITAETTPFEAGLGWAVKLKSGTDFIGREALLSKQKQPLKKRLACFTINDPDVVLLGRETIYRNGEIVGWLTSGGWGYTVNKNIGYGYVRNPEGVDSEYFISGTYELEVATVRHSCKLQLGPLYDPKLERVRK